MLLYILDLVGVFAFGSYGAYRALQARMDVLGAFVCSGLAAMGGGTVREVVLHGTPAYLLDYTYVLVVGLATTFATVLFRRFNVVDRYLVVLDSLGLATFALLGASRAAEEGLGLSGMILCAALTAVGGGVICDVMTGKPPQLFYGDFYAIPALLMAVLAWLFSHSLTSPAVAASLIVAVFTAHMSASRLGWKVWRPSSAAADNDLETVRMSRREMIQPPMPGWNEETVRLPTVLQFRNAHSSSATGRPDPLNSNSGRRGSEK